MTSSAWDSLLTLSGNFRFMSLGGKAGKRSRWELHHPHKDSWGVLKAISVEHFSSKSLKYLGLPGPGQSWISLATYVPKWKGGDNGEIICTLYRSSVFEEGKPQSHVHSFFMAYVFCFSLHQHWDFKSFDQRTCHCTASISLVVKSILGEPYHSIDPVSKKRDTKRKCDRNWGYCFDCFILLFIIFIYCSVFLDEKQKGIFPLGKPLLAAWFLCPCRGNWSEQDGRKYGEKARREENVSFLLLHF